MANDITQDVSRLLDTLTRRGRGRLIAALVRRLGVQQLMLAEDVAQEAVLAALALWPYRGIPDDPQAWLLRVAGNRAVDCLRRARREHPLDADRDVPDEFAQASFDEAVAADPDLQLMFLCCHPALAEMDQLALTLSIVGGFNARHIAEIFLVNEAAVGQRLARAKRKLRHTRNTLANEPTAQEIEQRLAPVLSVIYMMFSVGYAPQSGGQVIRRDVALEAVRLSHELADRADASPNAYALAALLSFQASRLDARETASGLPVLLRDQDPARWDHSLIAAGVEYLARAMGGRDVSHYHVEAAIASLYASAAKWADIDWHAIVALYALLESQSPSPVVVINASVAMAFAGDIELALARLDALTADERMQRYTPFHIARAEVLRLAARECDAKDSYLAAIRVGAPMPVVEHLQHRLATLL